MSRCLKLQTYYQADVCRMLDRLEVRAQFRDHPAQQS
jgi:hypothetical protein